MRRQKCLDAHRFADGSLLVRLGALLLRLGQLSACGILGGGGRGLCGGGGGCGGTPGAVLPQVQGEQRGGRGCGSVRAAQLLHLAVQIRLCAAGRACCVQESPCTASIGTMLCCHAAMLPEHLQRGTSNVAPPAWHLSWGRRCGGLIVEPTCLQPA